ncbi:MAG: hypothetical protein GJ680_07105 [Alteromonadaceae bacterium]|nr:hypothetical protein [Alteromonadaceae bacterium]
MNPVIEAQAVQLVRLLKAHQATKAHLFLEQTHLPYDVQDLILAATRHLSKYDEHMLEEIIECYASTSSFDERLLH